MVFKATFNNISVISGWSVLLVEKTGVPEKKNTDLPQFTDKPLSHNVISSPPRHFFTSLKKALQKTIGSVVYRVCLLLNKDITVRQRTETKLQ